MTKKITTILFFILIISNISHASVNQANKFANNFATDILEITSNDAHSTKTIRKNLVNKIQKNIDIKWISKFVLGKNWKAINAKQKKEFTKLYEEYLIYTYAPKFAEYKGETFKTIETKEIAPGKYINKITLILSEGKELPLEIFLLKKKDDSIKIVDISGAGVSLAATQRSEFNSVIAQHGIKKFLTMLESRVAQLKIDNPLD